MGALFVPVCVTWLPWGTEGFGMSCFAHGVLLGFPLHIGVCVFGLSSVFLELLIGMLFCVWFYLV